MEKLKVLEDVCIGCRACAAIAPDVFEINDEGYAQVKTETIPENLKEDVQDAKEGCPTGAIVETSNEE